MQKYLKWMRYLDLLSGLASLFYGAWLVIQGKLFQSVWPSIWLVGGLLGLGLAVLNPAGKIARIASQRLAGGHGNVKLDPGFPTPPSSDYIPASKR